MEKPRMHGESKLNAVRDGSRILRVITSEFFTTTPYTAVPAAAPEDPSGTWRPTHVRDADTHAAPVGQLSVERDPEAEDPGAA